MREGLVICVLLSLAGCANPSPVEQGPPPVVDPAWFENPQAFKNQVILFEPREVSLNEEARQKICEVASYMTTNSTAAVRVGGHASELGSAEKNRELGEKRAQVVRHELIRLGIAQERIDTISYANDTLPEHRKYPPCAEFVLLAPPQ
jgi:outer membrane protein OmpA-like peptidoglycan-associated protein